jgi:hypothetical protein
MQDVSGFGLRLTLRASVTFPAGITLTQFADDADPFDAPTQQIADKAMGLNGDLITWSKANPLIAGIAVIPKTDDDRNLEVLWEANRAGKGKSSARDVITIAAIFPDGSSALYTQGRLTDGPPANSVASAGRLKTKTYMFAFESVSRT